MKRLKQMIVSASFFVAKKVDKQEEMCGRFRY